MARIRRAALIRSKRITTKKLLLFLNLKKFYLIPEMQSKGTAYVPAHKMRHNFLTIYKEFVDQNSKGSNRLVYSYFTFLKFIGKKEILCSEIISDLCKKFRQYLLENFHGETPANYFLLFKKAIKASYKDGCFYENPTEFLASRTDKNFYAKEIFAPDEYKLLLQR